MDFGKRVKELRLKRELTKEEFCGDELDLSVRQLTRIESGQSTPTLAKVAFIARRLGLTISDLTADSHFELPQRYRELKYLLLRIQTYSDPVRLAKREAFFDEIFTSFYEQLPEEERLIIDCLQAKSDVNLTKKTDFGEGLLEDYFAQVKAKSSYSVNDFVLISLYFMCILVSNFDSKFYDAQLYQSIKQNLFQQIQTSPLEQLVLIHNLVLDTIEISFAQKVTDDLENSFNICYELMTKTQDFQKMPITCLLEWKYSLLFLGNKQRAQDCYNKALVFAQMTGDEFLADKLNTEWQKDMMTS